MKVKMYLIGVIVILALSILVLPAQAITDIPVTLDTSYYNHTFGSYMITLNNGDIYSVTAGDNDGDIMTTAVISGISRDNSLSANITHFSTYAVLEHWKPRTIVKTQEMWDYIPIPLVWRLDYDHANCPGNKEIESVWVYFIKIYIGGY